MSETDIVLCMLFIMVVAADTKKASVWHVLSVETTDYLKGIFATMILFHHITQVTGGSIFLNMGYLGVSGFLFCSGYGLFCSYNAQKDYVYKIIYRKIPEILLISFITIVYSAMYFNFLGGGYYCLSLQKY